jgi:hypothetical protein
LVNVLPPSSLPAWATITSFFPSLLMSAIVTSYGGHDI